MPVDKITIEDNPDKIRNGILKQKKRKFKLMNGEASGESHNKHLKNKKFEEKFFLNGNCDQEYKKKCFQYKNTENYAQIIAKPELLQSAPKIFSSNVCRRIKKKKQSNLFAFDILTKLSSNSNANNRFTCFPVIEDTEKSKTENFSKKNETVKENDEAVKKTIKKKIKSKVEPELKKESKSNKAKKKVVPFLETDDLNTSGVDSSSKIVSYADFYEVPHEKALIFHLHHPCKFNFRGELKLTLLAGEIEILGYTLNESSISRTVNVYSPELYTPLVIESKSVKESDSDKEKIRKSLDGLLTEENVNNLLVNFKRNDAILLVQQLVSTFDTIIYKYLNLSLFPKNIGDLSSMSESLKILESTFQFESSNAKREFKKNLEWEKIKLNQCTILCGGKGVGKSTLLKYYINQLISQGEKVLVLDFDPGQPEFTSPGYVSAVIVDKPLLGPNFTHVTEGELMVYFGGVNTNQFPFKYLECVDYIIRECRKNEELSKMKWLVNTMGFCKGLGIEFMISIIKLLKPSTVIQIQSSDDQNNYPFQLSSPVINSKKGFGMMEFDDDISFDHWVINSSAEIKSKRIQSGLLSVDLRKVMTLSYLSQMLPPPYHNFNAVQPYMIHFSKLYLGIDFLIRPNDVLKAFNGNLVSLSHFEPTTEVILSAETEAEDYFKIVLKPSVAPSFGLGFVRGIDCEKKKFYVITHLRLENLKNLNCLTLGRISAPSFMFLKQETIERPPVYTSVSTIEAVERVKRVFRK